MLDVAMVRVRQYFGFILAYSIHSWVLPHDLEVQCIRLVLSVKHKQCSQEVMRQSELLVTFLTALQMLLIPNTKKPTITWNVGLICDRIVYCSVAAGHSSALVPTAKHHSTHSRRGW